MSFIQNNLKILPIYYESGKIKSLGHYVDGYGALYTLGGPAYEEWYENGQIKYQEYWKDYKIHNISGPAFQHWYENGQLQNKSFCVNGEKHNISGPAKQEWDENGKLIKEYYWLNNVAYESLEKLQFAVKMSCLL